MKNNGKLKFDNFTSITAHHIFTFEKFQKIASRDVFK